MKKLHLVLKGKWYDMIDSGIKPEEYRDVIPHWEKRLMETHDMQNDMEHTTMVFKEFDVVEFQLGYQTDAKRMMFELSPTSISFGTGNPEWGAIPGKEYFVIKLGKRI